MENQGLSEKTEETEGHMAHLTPTDICGMLIATYSLDSMEFFYACLPAWASFSYHLEMNLNSVIHNPR